MAASVRPDRPNVVIFVGDDHGYGDLSCMGSPTVRTPRLDELAASGALLTNWYSNSPVCSPSRAALLSGRYPGNAGVRSILQGYRTTPGLTQDVPTLATALSELGYHTELVGKWHLGLTPESRPEAHGFASTFGHLAGAVDYYSHIHYSPNNRRVTMNGQTHLGTPLHDLWENGSEIYHDGEYLTDLVAGRAASAVRRAAAEAEPFFLYVPFNAPHYPLHAPAKYKERFDHLPWDQMIMAAMISALDDAVGSVLDELTRQGLRENTIVAYMSDNGPSREIRNWLDGTQTPYRGSSSGGLKGHKFSLFEGGIRVPGTVSWPAVIGAGQVIDEPMAAMDVFPTVLTAAGGKPERYELDGRDVLPVLADGAASPHDRLFWEQGAQTAVRQGCWKLVLNGQLEEGLPPAEPVFLADLAEDPGETMNRAAGHPEVVSELTAAATTWRDGIEQRWAEEWLPRIPDIDTYVFPPGVST
ncbi:sulfatase-like hydrolase/transferase [Saccharomonospora sp. NPDC046836]|uniref:sulfatase family protein n=1 Tax=Saccharomonospora sp. NPDC046836 TaxID=3156921 RepID=UPI00340C8825